MADMDTVLLVNTLTDTGGEYISCTLGPDSDKFTREELLAMCRTAIADVAAGNGEDIDLSR